MSISIMGDNEYNEYEKVVYDHLMEMINDKAMSA
jgi:hypothetical protein